MSEPWPCGAGAGQGGGVKKQQMETRRCQCWQCPGGVGHPQNTMCIILAIICVYVCVIVHILCIFSMIVLYVCTHMHKR